MGVSDPTFVPVVTVMIDILIFSNEHVLVEEVLFHSGAPNAEVFLRQTLQ